MNILVSILLAWLFADFITGVVHWAEDRLLDKPSRFKFLNAVKADNQLHHWKPTAMLRFTVSENINTSVVIAWPLALALFFASAPVAIWLGVFLSGFGNIVHRWAHTPATQLNGVIRFLQAIGFFVPSKSHWRHHFNKSGLIRSSQAVDRYCVMTAYLNPILDRVKFFRFLEFIFRRSA